MRAPGVGAALLSIGLGIALPVGAQDAAPLGDAAGRIRLALRTGYGLPFGHYADVRTLASFRDDDVNAIGDDTYGAIPLWLDLGYWVSSRLMIGGYFVYGLVLPKSAPATNPLSGGCPEGFDCAATGVRAGLEVEYTLLAGEPVRPWLGLGLGYEWVSTQIESSELGLKLESGNSGPEFLHLQGGADFRLSPSFALGPFLTLSALQYSSCELKLMGEEQSCKLDEQAWHGWILLGARGTLEFMDH